MDRFFTDEPLSESPRRVALAEDEAHHLRVVMRAQTGDEIIVFDGRGYEARARLARVERSGAEAEVLEITAASRRPAISITLAVALPRGGAADDVLRTAIEAGAARIAPLVTRRSVYRPERKSEDERARRFRRIALAAMKQSGINLFPELLPPRAPGELELAAGALGLFGSTRTGTPPLRELERRIGAYPADVCVAVGPEGGFEPAEEDALGARGFSAVSLGPQILRVETAVVAFLAVVGSAAPPRSRV
jgi:16S rRNA (uracil1498-N3)-methyltransferase